MQASENGPAKAPESTSLCRETIICAAVLAIVIASMALLTSPLSHSCPLNDDWNYARTVKTFLTEGKFLITSWSLAASLTNYTIGWLFCLPLGFSFTTLRISTLFMSWVASVASYRLMRALLVPVWLSYVAALVLIVNPLTFELANTFMTDVPFLALVVLFELAALKALNDLSWKAVIITTVAAIALVLSRQVGITLILAFSITATAVNRFSTANVNKSCLPTLAATAAIVAFQYWLKANYGLLPCYKVETAFLQAKAAMAPGLQLLLFMLSVLRAQFYIGLCVLPALVAYIGPALKGLDRARRIFAWLLIGELAALSFTVCVFANKYMPLADNILFDFGLGPIFSGQPAGSPVPWPTAPPAFWIALTAAAAIAGSAASAVVILKIMNLVDLKRERAPLKPESTAIFALLQIGTYLGIECYRGFFDRYLILVVPFYLMLLQSLLPGDYKSASPRPSIRVLLPLSITLFVYAAFSITATHDYLAFNKAKWQALSYLTDQEKISPMKIDGGLEFNGWYGYEPEYRREGVGLVFDQQMRHQNDYVAALSELANYKVLKKVTFARWLTPGEGTVYILEKLKDKAVK